MGYWLPEEIVYNILLRVPAEDLIRFKIVSKLWYSFISDHKFMNAHLALAATYAPRQIIFQFCRPIDISQYIISNAPLSCLCFNIEDLNLPIQKPLASLEQQLNRPVQLVSSCNGLFLVKIPELTLYNPVTRHFTSLPPPPLVHYPYVTLFHGNSVEKSKVLVMNCKDFGSSCFILAVTGNTSDRWREVKTVENTDGVCFSVSSQFQVLENALHWVAMCESLIAGYNDVFTSEVQSYYLLSMDGTTELCTTTKIPIKEDILKERRSFYLSEVKGSLCMVIVLADLVEIMILEKKDSWRWTTYCSIRLQSLSSKPAFLNSFLSQQTCVVVTPCSDYESLLYNVKVLVYHEEQFFLCDLKNHDWKRIGAGRRYLLAGYPLLHFNSLVHWE